MKKIIWIGVAVLAIYLAHAIPTALQEDAEYQSRCGFTSGPPLCTADTPIW